MDHSFGKKSKKSFRPSQRHVSLGIPTNIAIGPLGFRAQLDVQDPESERHRSPHDLGADRTDSTMVIDENDTRASRIVSQEREDNAPPAPETSTAGAVVGGDENGNGPISACF